MGDSIAFRAGAITELHVDFEQVLGAPVPTAPADPRTTELLLYELRNEPQAEAARGELLTIRGRAGGEGARRTQQLGGQTGPGVRDDQDRKSVV